jgi:hypothetical protein
MTRYARLTWGIPIAIGIGAVAGYLVAGRRRCLTWGATSDEAAGELPGDALLPGARLVSTRGISIDAPPSAIWPWLVQMGSGRGGAYTYDWIENLFGLDMHSADTILPEFQDLSVGDVIPLGADGPRMRVEQLERERVLVVKSDDGNWVWAFVLIPDGSTTRLISRNRIHLDHMPAVVRLPYAAIMEPGSLVMERKMLNGIKARAERLADTAEFGVAPNDG